ncbi:HAD family hydrolase [Thermomicrobium sp. CFH 73360]|uniref:HAD family hydrolase n=1 Tax=Thermomicrobium sp. CFH 73360 TaxID=2951987 RepID=UPI002077221C|nr:HAD family hydrolase [Thermomicrobium sp. CFH 73360]MCM8746804.1 HAD family hydrolase [Thermomicrobium sp. CFH 73360]
MAILSRWPRAIFYDSKTTLFDWAWSWRTAARQYIDQYGLSLSVDDFVEQWVKSFEGFQRTAAFGKYTPITHVSIKNALAMTYRLLGIDGDAERDMEVFKALQYDVPLFPDTEEALTAQQALGVKIIIYSDVESEYLETYVRKFQRFRPDFVGTTEQAGVHKPNPRTYRWVLHQMNLEPRDVIYCAAPEFDIQGAMATGMIAAKLFRKEGRLSKVTHAPSDLLPDFEIESLYDLTTLIELNRYPERYHRTD